MAVIPYHRALIVGAGAGISASLTRRLSAAGIKVAVVARDVAKLQPLLEQTGAIAIAADAAEPAEVEAMFAAVDTRLGEPDVVIYNAGMRVRGPLASLDPAQVQQALAVGAFGAFLVVQQAARRMERRGQGAILLTGATAGIKGFAQSAPFAMSKFALRGLAQSAARELGPKGIHVAHFMIDGAVRASHHDDASDAMLDPDGIADTYLHVLAQPRSAWSHDIDLRPWSERF